MRKHGPIDWIKATAVTALLLNAMIGAAVLTCGSCAPVDRSHIETYSDTYGQLVLERNTRTGEIRIQATVSVPAVCEGDSTNLDMSYDLAGIPTVETTAEGDVIYTVQELTETYMKAIMFVFADANTVLARTGACLNVPCQPNCVQGTFMLRRVVEQ